MTGSSVHPVPHAVGAAESTERWGYRPHLDGLRAVAVYLVVGFHAGIGRLTGGFVGVDVFFVLSGYLVTHVLLRDLAETGGRIRFARFYARRVRRLLPAAGVVLVATAYTYSYVATAVEVDEAQRAMRASALYFSNWFFIWESNSYFADDTGVSPFAHFWSLSVEEQFYFGWPVVLWALFAAARRLGSGGGGLRAVRRTVVVLAGASAVWAVHLAASNVDRAYYGTDSRAYQLLAGATLAFAPGLVTRLARRLPGLRGACWAALSFLALVVLATNAIDVNPVHRGVAVTAATVSLLLALEAGRTGSLARLLSRPSVVYLGKISYGTYLWHWLVNLLVDREMEIGAAPTALIVAAVATGLASLSFHLLEAPVREALLSERSQPIVIGVGVVCSLLIGVAVAPPLLESRTVRAEAIAGDDPRVQALLDNLTPVPSDYDHDAVFFDVERNETECVDSPPQGCILVAGSDLDVMVMGDSTAHMMVPAFEVLAERYGFTLIDGTRSGCPWQRNRYILGGDVRATCERLRPDTYDRVIPALDPDVVVVLNWEPTTREEDPGNRRDREIRSTTETSLDLLERPGRRIVVLESLPVPLDDGFRSAECLATAAYVAECRFEARVETMWNEMMVRDLARTDEALVTIDLDRMVCPLAPWCEAMIGDTVVWRVPNHLTAEYVEQMVPDLEDALRAEGVDLGWG